MRIRPLAQDAKLSRRLFEQLAEQIKSRMFMFDDITLLEDRDVQLVLRQVEEAQQKIIQVIRRLEDAGEIVLRRNADDEYVV